MQIALISTGLSIVLFLCLYLGFKQGVRLGMQTAKGQIPQKIDPINTVVQKVAEIKQTGQQNELLKGYAAMMNYTGEPKEDK